MTTSALPTGDRDNHKNSIVGSIKENTVGDPELDIKFSGLNKIKKRREIILW